MAARKVKANAVPAKLEAAGIPPNTKDVYRLADYVELQALLAAEGAYSHSDFVEDLKRAADIASESVLRSPEDEGEEDGADDDDAHEEDQASERDRVDGIATDVFQHLRFRATALKAEYPFKLDGSATTLTADDSAASDVRTFYTFLLLTSALSRVDRSSRQLLTKHFEVIAAKLFANHLGWRGDVHVFGTTASAAQSVFTGSLWKKVGQLAAFLGEVVVTKKSEFSPYDAGDNGLDIVGHLGFGDGASGRIIFFGQCACTDDWETKQHSATLDTWSSVLSFAQPIVPLTFIPFFFRDSTGAWFSARRIHRTILVDRLRLVHAFRLEKIAIPETLDARLSALVPSLKKAS